MEAQKFELTSSFEHFTFHTISDQHPYHLVPPTQQTVIQLFVCPCYVAQSCPTLCDPIECSLTGSSVHGISQARILEWISFPGDLPNPGIKPTSLTSPALAGGFFTTVPSGGPTEGGYTK